MIDWYNALTSLEQGFALVAIAATTFLFLQTGMLILGFGMHGSSDDGGFESHDHDGLDGQAEVDAHDFDHSFDTHDAPDFGDADADVDTDFDADTDFDTDSEPAHDFELDDDGPDIGHQQHQDAHSHNGFAEPSLRLFTMRGMVAFFALAGWSGLVALQSHWSLPAVFGAAFIAGSIGCYTVAKVLQVFLKLQDSGNVRLENAIGLSGEVYLRVPAHNQGHGKITMILQERYVELDAVTRHDEDLRPGSAVYIVDLLDEDTVIVKPKER